MGNTSAAQVEGIKKQLARTLPQDTWCFKESNSRRLDESCSERSLYLAPGQPNILLSDHYLFNVHIQIVQESFLLHVTHPESTSYTCCPRSLIWRRSMLRAAGTPGCETASPRASPACEWTAGPAGGYSGPARHLASTCLRVQTVDHTCSSQRALCALSVLHPSNFLVTIRE